MPWSWTPRRRNDPELMDAPGLPEAEVDDAYQVLRRVNRQLGNRRSIVREVNRFLAEDRPGAPFSLLDVGTGAGDIPRSLVTSFQTQPVAPRVLALDRDPRSVALARKDNLNVVRGDALRLPFGPRSIDIVTATKFAHHFEGEALGRLIAEMARVARSRVVVLDIRRHWLAYYGFVAWSRLMTSNRLVRYDGPLSVLRGFTRDELEAVAAPIAGFSWTVRPYFGFQLALVGRRLHPTKLLG